MGFHWKDKTKASEFFGIKDIRTIDRMMSDGELKFRELKGRKKGGIRIKIPKIPLESPLMGLKANAKELKYSRIVNKIEELQWIISAKHAKAYLIVLAISYDLPEENRFFFWNKERTLRIFLKELNSKIGGKLSNPFENIPDLKEIIKSVKKVSPSSKTFRSIIGNIFTTIAEENDIEINPSLLDKYPTVNILRPKKLIASIYSRRVDTSKNSNAELIDDSFQFPKEYANIEIPIRRAANNLNYYCKLSLYEKKLRDKISINLVSFISAKVCRELQRNTVKDENKLIENLCNGLMNLYSENLRLSERQKKNHVKYFSKISDAVKSAVKYYILDNSNKKLRKARLLKWAIPEFESCIRSLDRIYLNPQIPQKVIDIFERNNNTIFETEIVKGKEIPRLKDIDQDYSKELKADEKELLIGYIKNKNHISIIQYIEEYLNLNVLDGFLFILEQFPEKSDLIIEMAENYNNRNSTG